LKGREVPRPVETDSTMKKEESMKELINAPRGRILKVLFAGITLLVLQPSLGAMEVTIDRQGQKWNYTTHNKHSFTLVHTMQIEYHSRTPLQVESPKGWAVVNNDGVNVMWHSDSNNRDYWIRPGASLDGFVIYSADTEVGVGVYFVQGTDNATFFGNIEIPKAKSINKDSSAR
jgi:hypothetical protein